MDFEHFKRMILQRKDKSKKGSIDEKIAPLCSAINSKKEFATLSSCSGRIMLLVLPEENKKDVSQWLAVTHTLTGADMFIAALKAYDKKNLIYFRQEGAILHIAVKTIDDAQKLLDAAQKSGFKHSGILSFRKKIVVEIFSSEALSIPVFDQQQLVSDRYIEYAVELANKKLENSWKSMNKLLKMLV